MKNLIYSFFLIVFATICLSNLDGALPGNTNAPGEFTCGRAPCHNVAINVGEAEMSITFGEEETSYLADSTYQLKVEIANPLTNRNGFQIHAIDENLNNAGTWELIDPEKTKIISGFSNVSKKYVTHRAPGNQQDEWIINWKAPAGDVGKVTFYSSVLASNDNGENTGDEVYNTNVEIDFSMSTAIDLKITSSINVYPVISTEGVWIELPWSEENFKFYLFNMAGTVVAHKEVPHGGMQFMEIQGVASGMYLLKIEKEDEGSQVKKIFVR